MNLDFFEIAQNNLSEWRKSDCVKTLKIFTVDDDKVCEICGPQHNKIIPIEFAKVGVNLPPFPQCRHGCRCYFRPDKIEVNFD